MKNYIIIILCFCGALISSNMPIDPNILMEPFTDINGNGQYDNEETFIDLNNNNTWDPEEPYSDDNKNDKYDFAEYFNDINNNSIYDIAEPFIDKGNGVYDFGEDFIDYNNNKKRDEVLWYVDQNKNGLWDTGEEFEDLNGNGIKDYSEPFTDSNNNKRFDDKEPISNKKISFSAKIIAEPFTDSKNGNYDQNEDFEDINGDGKWTAAEDFEDINGDGKWTAAEDFEDINGDGKWTAAEDFDDINGDGKWTAAEQYEDINGDGKWGEYLIENPFDLNDDNTLNFNSNDIISNQNQLDSLDFSNVKDLYIRSKSPGKALLYSGIVPGVGQIYMNKWFRGFVFMLMDGIAITTMYGYNNQSEDTKREYANFANEHWSLGRWVHDYYKWYEYQDGNDSLSLIENAIREVFVNTSDTTLTMCGALEPPGSEDHCYIDIWDHSHSVEFVWDGKIISSNDEEEFKKVYQELCSDNNQFVYGRVCQKSQDEVNQILSERSTGIISSHHFFEGIQKYDMFFSGWDDNDMVSIVIKEHGDKNVTSPNQIAYRKIWNEYNQIRSIAANASKFMLINRLVSMFDSIILAKKWNTKNQTKLSAKAYPDLRNKTGFGRLEISIYF